MPALLRQEITGRYAGYVPWDQGPGKTSAPRRDLGLSVVRTSVPVEAVEAITAHRAVRGHHQMPSSWDQLGRAIIGWEYRAIVDVALILVSAGAGAGASILTAYATYRLTARQDQRKWRAELAQKYALLAADQPRAAQALARQFAVGVLIIEQGDTALREKVFIAPYTRMTAGRSDDNEIVLPNDLQ